MKSLTNYKTAYSLVSIIAVTIIVSAFGSGAFIYYINAKMLQENKSVIYILDEKGNALIANKSQQSLETRVFEYEDHVKDFYQLWYAYDQFSYKRNIETALNLIGEGGKELYNLDLEQDIFGMLREKNLTLTVSVTDVQINDTRPVTGKITGTQTIRRLKGKLTRNLIATFTLKDVDRSRNNPHGVIIENWKIIDNTQIPENNE